MILLFATVEEAVRPQPVPAPACPNCGGPLEELRSQQRCALCFFMICQSCDGERPAAVEVGCAS